MQDCQVPQINPNYFLEQFEDEMLLYSVTTSKAIHLNKTAFLVYGLCKTNQTIGDIISQLQDAYGGKVDKEIIRNDIIEALNTLFEVNAITLS